jgi:hypothetical protein
MKKFCPSGRARRVVNWHEKWSGRGEWRLKAWSPGRCFFINGVKSPAPLDTQCDTPGKFSPLILIAGSIIITLPKGDESWSSTYELQISLSSTSHPLTETELIRGFLERNLEGRVAVGPQILVERDGDSNVQELYPADHKFDSAAAVFKLVL